MTTQDNALDQAKMQARSIADMVAALNVDYDRLNDLFGELKDAAEDQAEGVSVPNWIEDQANDSQAVFHSEAVEYLELKEAAENCEDEDHARERIQEDALEVQVRSDWASVGATLEATEFSILLCTGGPAVRIIGELDNMQPCRAWIEYQDWGTPWTQAFNVIEHDTLLQYCQQFWFGE